MKLVFASDSFKGSLTSAQIAALLTRAAREVFGECECIGVPVADGGEGTVDAVCDALNGERITADVHDPLMRPVQATYAIAGDKAVIEMAASSGLTLIPDGMRNPLFTTTYGVGELILDALDHGCRELYIAIGGSATNDGGMGCMRALGARFLDRNESELVGRGVDLTQVAGISLDRMDPRLSQARITALCDVTNPLCGSNGATYTFAAQKGATPEAIELLESGMCHYRDLILKQYGVDCNTFNGAGAAGGLGAALMTFLHAETRSGVEAVLDLIGFDRMLDGADLVVTGEGRADRQSCCGKVMQGVAGRARAKGIPAIGLCGSLGEGAEELYAYGVTSLTTVVSRDVSLHEAMTHAAPRYYEAAVRMFRALFYQGKLPGFCDNCQFILNGSLQRLAVPDPGDGFYRRRRISKFYHDYCKEHGDE